MSTQPLKPKPSFCFTSFPAKRTGETEEQFNKRVLEFLKENKFSEEQQKHWTETKSIRFTLPQDKDALKAFMDANPGAELTMVSTSSDRDELKNGLRELQALGLGYLNKVSMIKIVDKLDYTGKELNILDKRTLDKLKDDILPPRPRPARY